MKKILKFFTHIYNLWAPNFWDERPWGEYKTIDITKTYAVKTITVKPGGRLSLQSHNHRDEFWTVVAGEGERIVGSQVHRVVIGDYVIVPRTVAHRIKNDGKENLIFIEVQIGSPDESDIIRYEDDYGRQGRNQ